MDDPEEQDELIQKFIGGEKNSLYVKANSVELRCHLLSMFSPLLIEIGSDALVDELQKIEHYVKYG